MQSRDAHVVVVGAGAPGLCDAVARAHVDCDGAGAGLKAAVAEISRLKSGLAPEEISMLSRLNLAEAMVAAALRREESRGAHWRSDFTRRNTAIDGARACVSPGVRGCAGAPAGARRARRGDHRAGSGTPDG
jgi:succinate dehydrogenase/fumarate reductase flavoprotein subunit